MRRKVSSNITIFARVTLAFYLAFTATSLVAFIYALLFDGNMDAFASVAGSCPFEGDSVLAVWGILMFTARMVASGLVYYFVRGVALLVYPGTEAGKPVGNAFKKPPALKKKKTGKVKAKKLKAPEPELEDIEEDVPAPVDNGPYAEKW